MVGLCIVPLVLLATFGAEAQTTENRLLRQVLPANLLRCQGGDPVKIEKRMAASIVRLHFHNCFVNAIVRGFSLNHANLFRQYGLSSVKMANIKPLTGSQGEIRRNYRFVNSVPAVAFE